MDTIFNGLKRHIIKMGLVPVLILTVSFGTLGTLLAINQINNNFIRQVEADSWQIAIHAESVLNNETAEQINDIARLSLKQRALEQRALKQRGLNSLRISDRDGHALIQVGPPINTDNYYPTPAPKTRPLLLKSRNTLLTTTPINVEPGYWLELEYTRESVLLEQYQWILLGVVISLITLSIAIIFHIRLANSIAYPLSRITMGIRQIKANNLDVRLIPEQKSVMKALTHNINMLLAKVQNSHREMQEEVEQTSKELQENMETLELQNAELDLSRKVALEASRTKSEFLANMSHEMRTPLNSISGYTSLLQRSELDDIQKEHLRTLSTAANALQSIIADILDFAKLEAGKLVLEEAPMDLRTVVDEVLAMNSPAADSKNLELAALCYPDTPLNLIGDANRLKQIISNLLSNAIKFTNEGSVIVRVMCETLLDSYATLRISVEDTGIGISRNNAKKLFQAFSQVDSSRNRNSTGTGLGLVICKNLVEQMHGSIEFDSQPDQGSRFWFTFRAPLDRHAVHSPQLLPIPPKAYLLEPGRWNRVSASQLLQESGFAVEDVHNIEELSERLNGSEEPTFIVIGHDRECISEVQIREALQCSPKGSRFLILSSTADISNLNHLRRSKVAILPRPLSQVRTKEILERLYSPQKDHETVAHNGSHLEPCSSLRVLAVDDNEPNLKLLATMLRDIGITVDTAFSGREALELIKQDEYSLVFMDIQMPEMDGLEVTRRIRKNEGKKQHLPIIALTAHALADEKQQLLAAGMDDYLTKPISDQQLRHVISIWSHSRPLPPKKPAMVAQTPTAGGYGPVDKDEGVRLAGGREELADELLDMLLKDLEQNAQELQTLHHQQQYMHLLEAVHKLHGAARYCGVPHLRKSCRELEVLLKQAENLDSLEEAFDELLGEINRLLVWQERFNFDKLA
ncbi:ATP-binding protein [Sansalvadorimonas sp. 2012CJ34-2]|uniref:histidine kinase n=1 Tax=Parendozoicomonas callyspongiae TaxID=2942213 RepID=A0ABT0PJN5_9GAMM|nr:response regulator [Sansalvadorimonas sp. 2012CJ34-2]MCL6271578.1 ATP-binding protein [Sansalvadorimonas sp. 2012CJ34-2]